MRAIQIRRGVGDWRPAPLRYRMEVSSDRAARINVNREPGLV